MDNYKSFKNENYFGSQFITQISDYAIVFVKKEREKIKSHYFFFINNRRLPIPYFF